MANIGQSGAGVLTTPVARRRRPRPNTIRRLLPQPDSTVSWYASTPATRLEAWTSYFKTLLHRDPPPAVTEKPWLKCEAAHRFQAKLSGVNAFLWPRRLTLDQLQMTLRKGNSKPSPGPDRWEKWLLKQAGDDFLEIIVELLNYTIQHNHFPPRIKQISFPPLYKRGASTDPRN